MTAPEEHAAGVCLVVLDGWGLAEPGPGNAVSLAATPVFDQLWATYPHTTLTACGAAVGLPEGQMGNSEVGHLNLGAGAVVKQDLVRIDDAISDGSLAENRVLREAFSGAPRVHLIGLVSDGGVHSSLEHLRALIALGEEVAPGVDLVVHAFTDGRDTLPHAGAGYLAELDRIAGMRVGSVVGRYWAMDRDRRCDIGAAARQFGKGWGQRVRLPDIGRAFEMVAGAVGELAVINEDDGAAVLWHQRIGQR